MSLGNIIICKFELKTRNYYHSTCEQQNTQLVLDIPRITYILTPLSE